MGIYNLNAVTRTVYNVKRAPAVHCVLEQSSTYGLTEILFFDQNNLVRGSAVILLPVWRLHVLPTLRLNISLLQFNAQMRLTLLPEKTSLMGMLLLLLIWSI